ncbi:MAG: exopolysaccharide biosynthesis polyprenyl glycosylphosphotransferase, partial [Phascolarctobacterium sp.]|nr:exopolysaccharide biosynthesis polyprenyl glycosylphosphotransferase [Candidatus Phascolarctobacterium caballi]
YVIICAPKMFSEKLNGLVYRIQPLVRHLSIIPNLVDIPMCEVEVETFFAERMMSLRMRNNLLLWYNRWLKNLLDYVGTIVGLILLSPVFLIIAILIYMEDPGPVFYKHMRVGKQGKVFPCYKFRSMCVNSQERLEELLANDESARKEWESSFKLKNDPRITKIGGKLRRTSLDELPQLFNVLRGEMSLVGPRPVIQKELDEFYKENAELYKIVKPGITGMWQVSGRSDVNYDERIAMDNWYICNWSVWLDVMLLWRTVKVVLGGKGAY